MLDMTNRGHTSGNGIRGYLRWLFHILAPKGSRADRILDKLRMRWGWDRYPFSCVIGKGEYRN